MNNRGTWPALFLLEYQSKPASASSPCPEHPFPAVPRQGAEGPRPWAGCVAPGEGLSHCPHSKQLVAQRTSSKLSMKGGVPGLSSRGSSAPTGFSQNPETSSSAQPHSATAQRALPAPELGI